jgi:hypothetical protein
MAARQCRINLRVIAVVVFMCLAAGGRGLAQIPLKGPDLVIREIMVTEVGAGPVGANLSVGVGVENIGQGQAGSFNLALMYVSNTTFEHPYVKIEWKQVSPLAPGDALMVSFVIPAHPGTPAKGMLIAIADPPIVGHPAGAMMEGRWPMVALGVATRGRTDINNVFGVIFDASGHDMPVRWRNPAVAD